MLDTIDLFLRYVRAVETWLKQEEVDKSVTLHFRAKVYKLMKFAIQSVVG